MNTLHTPSYRLNMIVFAVFMILSVIILNIMPERYPIHFDLAGNPTRWAEGNAVELLILIFFGAFSFVSVTVMQRYLIGDPNSGYLNIPNKKKFLELPEEQKVRILRRLNRMLGYVNTFVLLTFISILLMMWSAAAYPGSAFEQICQLFFYFSIILVLAFPLVDMIFISRYISQKYREHEQMGKSDS